LPEKSPEKRAKGGRGREDDGELEAMVAGYPPRSIWKLKPPRLAEEPIAPSSDLERVSPGGTAIGEFAQSFDEAEFRGWCLPGAYRTEPAARISLQHSHISRWST
jgi:hypothetical protein